MLSKFTRYESTMIFYKTRYEDDKIYAIPLDIWLSISENYNKEVVPQSYFSVHYGITGRISTYYSREREGW